VPTALETLRASKLHDVTLPSGTNVTIRLPRLRDCVVAGDVPMSVLTKLQDKASKNGKAPDMSPEEMRYVFRFNDEIVRAAVVAVEGDPVDLSLEDVKLFDDDDCNELVAYGLREKALPKAADQLSPSSPTPSDAPA
jgi:hypothetical protein